MKTYIFKVIVMFFLLGVPETMAHVPSSRRAEGIIEHIDIKSRTIKIQSNSEVYVFHWNDRTRFILNDKKVEQIFPQVGTTIDYWYIRPLFGNPVVKRITWGDINNT